MIELAKYLFHFPQLVGLLGAIGAAYFALRIGRLEKSPAKRVLTIGACAASVLLIVSGVLSGFEQAKSDKLLVNTVESNATLNNRIAEMANEHSAWLTGGKNFCYFDPIETSSNVFTWYLVRQGQGPQAPIYDISGSIIDVHKLRTQEQSGTPTAPNARALAIATERFSIGTMNPEEHRIFRTTDLSGMTSQAYIIDFRSRNGSWKQAICFELVDGKWTRAVKFTPPGHGDLSFISSEPWITGNFPSNAVP